MRNHKIDLPRQSTIFFIFTTILLSTTLLVDGWKSPDNWKKVKKGMSISQLEGMLGLPTSKGTGAMGPIWFYEGYVQGSGNVTGNIQFYQRRVWDINKPVF